MPLEHKFPVPSWARDDHQRFAVSLAALYHHPSGSVALLSKASGHSHAGLNMALKGSGLSEKTCLALEALLGAENFPRQFFRPDLFPESTEG